MAEDNWKLDPLMVLSGRKLYVNQDPDAKKSLDRYYGRGTGALKKYGEFLEPIQPGTTKHAKGGKVIKSEKY